MLKHLLPSLRDALGTHNPRAGASTKCITGCGNCCPPAGLGLAQARAVQEPRLATRLTLALQRTAWHGLRQGKCQADSSSGCIRHLQPGPMPREAAGIPAPCSDREARKGCHAHNKDSVFIQSKGAVALLASVVHLLLPRCLPYTRSPPQTRTAALQGHAPACSSQAAGHGEQQGTQKRPLSCSSSYVGHFHKVTGCTQSIVAQQAGLPCNLLLLSVSIPLPQNRSMVPCTGLCFQQVAQGQLTSSKFTFRLNSD